MIGLIVGTSEGKNIVCELNKFTENLFISTATSYGAEIMRDFKYKVLNSSPLDSKGLVEVIRNHNIRVLIDSSHPYALEITKNTMAACNKCGIQYVRYERPSTLDKLTENDKVIVVDDYEELYDHLKNIDGNILNTTGSRNIEKIMNLNIKSRIIHRVLPSVKVLEEILNLGVATEDIIAIKGPVSYDLNCSFIREYDAKAVIMKDSGEAGGTEEKIKAAIDNGIYSIVINRKKVNYDKVFYNEKELVAYIKKNWL